MTSTVQVLDLYRAQLRTLLFPLLDDVDAFRLLRICRSLRLDLFGDYTVKQNIIVGPRVDWLMNSVRLGQRLPHIKRIEITNSKAEWTLLCQWPRLFDCVDTVVLLVQPRSNKRKRVNETDLSILPRSTNFLRIQGSFRGCTVIGDLPPKLTSILDQSQHWNMQLRPGWLPETLRSAVISCDHAIVPYMLPASLISLDLGGRNNHPFPPQSLPAGLIHLSLPAKFNHQLRADWLPRSLQSFNIGHSLNTPIDPGVLPMSLTTLTFYDYSTQITAAVFEALPRLTCLRFDGHQTLNPIQSIPIESLPRSLKELRLPPGFTRQILPMTLPPGLTEFDFGSSWNNPVIRQSLPEGLSSLSMGMLFNQFLQPGTLPESLEKLRLSAMYNQPFVAGALPNNMRKLWFAGESRFNKPIEVGVLPTSLSELDLGHQFNHALIAHAFPISLRKLTLSNCYNSPLSRSLLPDHLAELVIGQSFDQPLSADVWPLSLISLSFKGPMSYSGRLNKSTLPPNLTYLSLASSWRPVSPPWNRIRTPTASIFPDDMPERLTCYYIEQSQKFDLFSFFSF